MTEGSNNLRKWESAMTGCVRRVMTQVSLMAVLLAFPVRGDEVDPARKAIVQASSAYAEAYNARNYEALADQWVERAELVEGGARVVGRDAIVKSIRGWLEKHGQATIQIDVEQVDLVATSLARVDGVILFTPAKNEAVISSRFSSLRVLEGGSWRLVESVVAPSHAAALHDLGWLVGAWQATDDTTGMTVDLVFDKAAGGFALVGRTTMRSKTGATREAIEVIHADRDDGLVRTAIIDSLGAHAEGVIESDGMTLNRVLTGVPGDAVAGSRVQYVQTVVPGGEGQFTLHSIERSIDGRPVPDGAPLHFKKRSSD
jgi:uncharacterized protein (TIGR02246 family)